MDNSNKLSKLSISLHWIVAGVIIGLCALGVYMSRTEAWDLYPIHKSLGVLIFLVAGLRVIVRIKNGWPKAVADYSRLEQVMAKIVKWALIIGSILLPVSGMLHSGASGHGFDVFGLVIVPGQHVPGNPEEALAYSEFWAKIGEFLHQTGGYILIAAIVLHVVGAFKHHFVDRDATLRRMLGK